MRETHFFNGQEQTRLYDVREREERERERERERDQDATIYLIVVFGILVYYNELVVCIAEFYTYM